MRDLFKKAAVLLAAIILFAGCAPQGAPGRPDQWKEPNLSKAVSFDMLLLGTYEDSIMKSKSVPFLNAEGEVLLAFQEEKLSDTLSGAAVYTYWGPTEGLAGKPVTAWFKDESRTELLKIEARGTDETYMSGQLSTDGKGKYFALGEKIELAEGFSSQSAPYMSSSGMLFTAWMDSNFFFMSSGDEIVTLCDGDGDGKIDWIWCEIVYNGMQITGIDGQNVTTTGSLGSQVYTDVNPKKAVSAEGLSVGDYVNAAMIYRGGELMFDFEKADTAEGLLASVKRHSVSVLDFKLDEKDYAFTIFYSTNDASDGASGVNAGRQYINSAYEGSFVRLVLDKNGGAVKAEIEFAATSVDIEKLPDRVLYGNGEKLDPAGMVVSVTYADGSKKEITDYKIQEEALKTGDTAAYLTVSFKEGEKKLSVPITVYDKIIISASVLKKPDKLSFAEGEQLDLSGGVLDVTYNDGSKGTLPADSDTIKVFGFNRYGNIKLELVAHTASCELEITRPYDLKGYTREFSDGRMFDASNSQGIYNYCPSVMEIDGIRHIYYCTNRDPFKIIDYIGYRKAVNYNGAWYYSPEKLVLSAPGLPVPSRATHSGGPWDNEHDCDPSVIKGEFSYNGESYGYLMAFLGCDNTAVKDNEVGLAVAKSPEGPWVKTELINPIVMSPRDMQTWGAGQPAVVSIDGKGQVLLFYTSGGTIVEKWDFSDLNNPVRDKTFTGGGSISGIKLTTKGTVRRNSNSQNSFYNGDFMFDPETGRLYCLIEQQPHYIEGEPSKPSIVGSVQVLMYYSITGDDPSELLRDQSGEWIVTHYINPEMTGFPRNHNAGIITDEYGYKLPGGIIEVGVTTNDAGESGNDVTYLWSYRIHRYELEVK